MRNHTFTLYQSRFDNYGRPTTLPWQQWVEDYFSKHDVRGTIEDSSDKKVLDAMKDGLGAVLGVIREGLGHKKANVEEIHALSLDIEDRTDEQVYAALDVLSPYHYAAWTTHKHGSIVAGGYARIRVIIPLAEPLDPQKLSSVWTRMNAFVGEVNDPQTKDLSRVNFFPSTFDISFAEAWSNEGRFLSVDELPIVASTAETKVEINDAYQELRDQEAVTRVRGRMKSKQKDEPLFGLVLRNDSLATPGERHKALLKLTWWLSAKERELSDVALAELFGGSLEVMMAEDPAWNGYGELSKMYADAVVKRIADAGNKAEPYDVEELQFIAQQQGCSIDDLSRRWILQHHDAFFFLQANGYYSKPVTNRDAARTKAVQVLARAPVMLNEPSPTGVRRRPIAELVEEYGWYCDNLITDVVSSGTWFDAADSTIREATCPLRVTEAQHDPEIERWLELLAGSEQAYAELLDWLTVFPNLSRNTAALYLRGPTGVGKSIFFTGLARFWTKGAATSLESVFSNFNEKLAACPLVVADEGIARRPGKDPTADLRRLVGIHEHELNRKFRTTSTLHGALRIIIAANNVDLLRGSAHTPDDYAALTKRFIVMQANPDAVDYLESLGGETYLHPKWVESDAIAKHVLHLVLTREEPKGKRFAVSGNDSAAHREIFSTPMGDLVREWLLKYCEAPGLVDTNPQMKALIRVGDGKMLVRADALKTGWTLYHGMNTKDDVKLKTLGRALALISVQNKSGGRVQREVGGNRAWLYDIEVKHLIDYSNEHGVGSPDAVLRIVNRSLKESKVA